MVSNKALLVRALRGPLLLTTLGALFALDYFSGYPITKTWPILLILFGVLKLAEKLPGSDTGAGESPAGGAA